MCSLKGRFEVRTDGKGEARWPGQAGEQADLSVAASYKQVPKIVLQTGII